ncbi:MAG: gliding motility-associated C-terminal domain-containing protein [Bacteroidota bacterium]
MSGFLFETRAQTCDNPELLCFGNNFLNYTMDSAQSGLDAPCFTANNSFYFSFFTNDIGGDVTVDIDILDCIDSVNYDTDLEIAIIETTDLCNGPYTYLACNAASGGPLSISATGLDANTTYYVQVDGDLNGPGITNPAQCGINPALSGNGVEFNYTASPDEFIISGQSAQLGATGGTQYNWLPAASLSNPFISDPIASPTESTEYTVEIINGPCVVTRRVWVFVFPPITVYDAFTPNGDGFNDDWVITRIENFPQCSVNVFDRWGQLVFKSIGYPTPWDGTRNGNALTAGNYYYVIELNDDEVNENLFTGSVTIIY